MKSWWWWCCSCYFLAYQLAGCAFAPRGAGDRDGLKMLIIQADDRSLRHTLHDAHYLAMTAALNLKYAEANGYDYLFLHVNASRLVAALGTGYNVSNFDETTKNKRYKPSILHPGLKRLRGQSWGKLLALLHVSRKFGGQYDYFLFLDPDANINSYRHGQSLADVLRRWQDGRSTSVINSSFVQWGQRNLSEASMIVMTNTPWRDDFPNAGFILMKSGSGVPLMAEWWNYAIPEKDVEDFHEQDALWYMVEASGDSYGFAINPSTTSMIYEPFLLSPFLHLRDMWAVHMPNYEWNQLVYLSHMLNLLDIDESSFSSLISRIVSEHEEVLDTLDAAEREFSTSWVHKPRRGSFPPVLQGGEDSVWHLSSSSKLWINSKRSRSFFELTPAQLLDGFSFRLMNHREVFFVQNGSRHLFQDVESFHQLNQSKARTFHLLEKRGFQFSQDWFTRLSEGEPIPKAHIGPLPDLSAMYWDPNTTDEERWFNDFPPLFGDGFGVKREDHRSKEIWFIANRSRHSIPNWDTFLSLNFTGAVFQLKDYQLELIPIGAPLPTIP